MTQPAIYTPGHSADVTAFMARRSAESHAAFALPHLQPHWRVLDLGCGPGTITVGLAARVPQGEVLGLDLSPGQIERARELARTRGLTNVTFAVGAIETAALPAGSFDAIFAHAVFEHIGVPVDVLRRLRPLLRPNGLILMRSPEWGGFVVHPGGSAIEQAMKAYADLQRRNGGNLYAGRELGFWLVAAGFALRARSASYQIYEDPMLIASYLADQLERAGQNEAGATLRQWAQTPHAMFAQAWFEAIGARE